MSQQMSFVYVKSTGHVLSVFTTLATLKGKITAGDIASPTLLIRGVFDDSAQPKAILDADFALPSELLDVFTADIIEDSLPNPRNYWWNSATNQIEGLPNPGSVAVSATAAGITVTLAPVPSNNTTVLVAFPGSSDPAKSDVPPTQDIPANSPSTTFSPSGLVANAYVLVLAAGYSPIISKIT